MYLLGLCGRSGSGKSTICKFLRQKGVYCIDADEVCHRVYDTDEACIKELSDRFGACIITDGKVNRNALRKAAFGSENGVEDLNTIAHKYITEAILKETNDAFSKGYKYVLLDAPALFEAGLSARCDAIIMTIANYKDSLARLKKRDKLPKTDLEKRLSVQKTNRFLFQNSTCVVVNNGSLKKLRQNALKAMLVIQLKLGVIKPPKEAKRYVCKKL